MTMLPPFLPQSIRYGNNAFPDVEPFSIRAAASYEDIQYSIVTWIRDQLVPWIEENGAGTVWQSAADALVADVNAALAAEAADFASRYGQFFQGSIVAPPPTGVAATDTANLLTAITTAQSRHADLILTPSTTGAQLTYKLIQPLTWNLNRGGILASGQVTLDFSQVVTSYQGAALTLTTNADTSEGSHRSTTHRVQGFRMVGHNTDASTMDGIIVVEGMPGFGNDMGVVEQVYLTGFRDNVTFGPDVWSFDFRKCSIANAHRYNINGIGAGECMQFTECNLWGASNAAGTAANVYTPPAASIDVRFYGGSFDYPGGSGQVGGTAGAGGIQGIIQGGCISFDKVHFEDSNTGPMFTYTCPAATGVDVTFRDCYWGSTAQSARDHLHEILPSARDAITIRFEGDKGNVTGLSAQKWLIDNSGSTTNGISVTYNGFAVGVNGNGPSGLPVALTLAPFGTLGVNTRFETTNTFVTGGALGWTAGAVDTWTIGTANARQGNCLQLVGAGTNGTNAAYQRMRIPPTRRPIIVTGYQQVTGYTSGSVGLYARFYAEDGTTVVSSSDYRIGNDLSALSGWVGKTRRIIPPSGSAYIEIRANGNLFQGTAQWDDIEVVPV